VSILTIVQRNRGRLDGVLGEGHRRAFSAVAASRVEETERAIASHATGRVLDVGCGRMPFRESVLRHAASYEGLDREARRDGVAYLTDVVTMSGVPRDSFDTVLCLEVLEHVPSPQRALGAIREVMRPGAKLVVTVPHLSRLHEQPHDYWRFTEHGLRAIAEAAGLEVVELRPHAGLASFIGHQASTLLLGLTWQVPVVRQVALVLNRAVLVPVPRWIDRVIDPSHLAPAGYVLVASRPGEGT
jgi:SAM-dependent methyltransferase